MKILLCPEANGIFPDPDDCEAFYKCIHSQPFLFHCPSGLAFNAELRVCDLPDVVGCVVEKVVDGAVDLP